MANEFQSRSDGGSGGGEGKPVVVCGGGGGDGGLRGRKSMCLRAVDCRLV